MVNVGERSGPQKHRAFKKNRYYRSEARVRMYGSGGIFSAAVNIAITFILCLGLYYISDLVSGIGFDRFTNLNANASKLLTSILSLLIKLSISFVFNVSLIGTYRSVFCKKESERYALSDLLTPDGFRYSIKLYSILTFLKSPIFAIALALDHFKEQICNISYCAFPVLTFSAFILCFIYLSYLIAAVSVLPYAEDRYGRKVLKITAFILKNARKGSSSSLVLLISFTPQFLISAMTFFISFIGYTGPYMMYSISELGRHIYLENNLRKDNKINE